MSPEESRVLRGHDAKQAEAKKKPRVGSASPARQNYQCEPVGRSAERFGGVVRQGHGRNAAASRGHSAPAVGQCRSPVSLRDGTRSFTAVATGGSGFLGVEEGCLQPLA